MPRLRQSVESNEQQSKRGGKRPGAGRKPNPVTILLKGTSRATLLQALENVDPQLVGAKITKLLQSKTQRLASHQQDGTTITSKRIRAC
jgi:hypothetical protein